LIKYLGSKRRLIPLLLAVIRALEPSGTALDLFSGTSRVGMALKAAGYRVLANDHNAYAEVLARCYVQADRARWHAAATRLIAELDQIPGVAGWFTAMYCESARFFRPENGARIDAIRAAIAAKGLDPELEAIALTSLMEAADRVDSTTGVHMAFLKQWAPRAHNPLALRVPELIAGGGAAHRLDALDAAATLAGDVAYLDPPYNQHKYVGNYHLWESLVRWDKPEVYGLTNKRADCRDRTSAFNSKKAAPDAFRALIRAIRARHLVVSFNDEGHLARADVEAMLAERGHVHVIARSQPRYVGARIGIYNPAGEKVGAVGHLANTELVFVVSEDPAAIARVAAATAA
jgi:adenine-specific DNA-methyltransferase